MGEIWCRVVSEGCEKRGKKGGFGGREEYAGGGERLEVERKGRGRNSKEGAYNQVADENLQNLGA